MPLVIRARSLNDDSSSLAIVCTFDERGGTIGRADTSTLMLPDPARHVSRVQGVVVFHQGVYTIENVGSSNPVVINGWPMRRGEVTELFHGDLLTMGQYTLAVEMTNGTVPSVFEAHQAQQIPAVSLSTSPKAVTPSDMLTTVAMTTQAALPQALGDGPSADLEPPQGLRQRRSSQS